MQTAVNHGRGVYAIMQSMHNGVSANEEGDNRQGKSNLCSACGRFATDFAIRLIRFRGCNSRLGTRASLVPTSLWTQTFRSRELSRAPSLFVFCFVFYPGICQIVTLSASPTPKTLVLVAILPSRFTELLVSCRFCAVVFSVS